MNNYDKTTPINLLVTDAKILYPLLLLCRYGIIEDSNLKEEIVKAAKSSYTYYDQYYRNGHYYFQKGTCFWADGVNLPWNQQNAFGLCLIELYRITGENAYKERVVELAKALKTEMIADGERLVWFYWPNSFYSGWTADDNISVNTPVYKPTKPIFYEDVSHAGINVKFINEFFKIFPGIVFNSADMKQDQMFLCIMVGQTLRFRNLKANSRVGCNIMECFLIVRKLMHIHTKLPNKIRQT